MHPSSPAFTRIELVVVLAIVAVILVLAWPAFTNALVKRDLTRTMNNGRELYLAAFRMATDGAAKSDASLAWPGDYPVNSLAEYCGKLIEKDYVKPAELQRMLSALKVYKVKSADPSNTIFAASSKSRNRDRLRS